MLKLLLAALIMLLSVAPIGATTIQFTVPPALIGVNSGGDIDLFSSGLNGTLLQGQTLALDLVFADAVLGRLSLTGLDLLGVGITVYTNAGPTGDAGPATGYLLDASGQPLQAPVSAGRASFGSPPWGFIAGIDFDPQILDPSLPLSGVHFDIQFPTGGFLVTDVRLRFSMFGNTLELGTATQLPEPSTFTLVAFGLAGLIGWRLRTCLRLTA